MIVRLDSKGLLKSALALFLLAPFLKADSTALVDAELKKHWPKNRTVNIVFHGHSVPSGYHRTPQVKPFESYPHLFRQTLAERYPHAVFNVITTAIGGENSAQGASRFKKEVIPHRPDLILIDYALNDRRLPIDVVEKAWRRMIQEAKSSRIPLILITPTGATNANFSNPDDPLTIRAQLLRKLARETDVMLADVSLAWQAAIKSGTSQGDLLSQGNHPNLAGHQIASSVITQTFVASIDGSTILRGDQFPREGKTQTLTTADQQLSFKTSNTFAGRQDIVGDSGGRDSEPLAWNGEEELQIKVGPSAKLRGFGLRWTRAKITISGFAENPSAVISSSDSQPEWDATTKSVTITVPWNNGNHQSVRFQNAATTTGRELTFKFRDDSPGWKTCFTWFHYQSGN
ncbi:SGNH/GDSL hydrolase family protein [bacterium]|nr:SGNH/GDSL hydrolase family protein [bacterium]